MPHRRADSEGASRVSLDSALTGTAIHKNEGRAKDNYIPQDSQQSKSESYNGSQKKTEQLEEEEAKQPREEMKHPLDAANLISLLTFGCWARELTSKDATSLDGALKAQVRPPQSTNKPSLIRALLRAQAGSLLLGLLLTLTSECLFKTLCAYSVGQVLKLMSLREVTGTLSSVYWSFSDPLCMWTSLLVLSCFSHVIIAHFYGFHMMRLGLRAKTGCSYLIYNKALRLGQQESIQKTMSRVFNLISNDLEKLVMFALLGPFLIVGPIQTLISLYLLWPSLGYSCLGAVFAICTLTPIQIYLNFKYGHLRKTIAAYADERVRKVNEIIMALKLIKLYGWEYSLRDALMEVRKRETDLIERESLIKGISNALVCISTKLVLFVTIITHCLMLGQTMNTHTLFISMAMLNNLHITMNMIVPRATAWFMEAWIGCHRVQDFLLTPEYKRTQKQVKENSWQAKALADICSNEKTMSLAARVEYVGVNANWVGSARKTLEHISFRCEAPELIVLCGQVASGKSSILLSIIGELPIESGSALVRGSTAYCSQNAWTFEGSIRDNIVFGRTFDEQRYEQVVDICALRRDFQLLSSGDLTYIQENTLSGGQKARVNLARCLYEEHDMYLLDDPLSALDSRVARQIFEEAIKKFLKGKLVIMSSHQIELIKQSDRLLLIDKGKQLAFCTFDELCDKVYSDHEFRKGHSKETLSWLKSLTIASGSPIEGGGDKVDEDSNTCGRNNCFTDLANYGKSRVSRSTQEYSKSFRGEVKRQHSVPLYAPDKLTGWSEDSKNIEAPREKVDIGSELIGGRNEAAGAHGGIAESHPPYGTSSLLTNEDKTLIIVHNREQENSTDSTSHGCHSKVVPNGDLEQRLQETQVRADENHSSGGGDDDDKTRATNANSRENAKSSLTNKVHLISDGSQSPTNYRTGLDQSCGCTCDGAQVKSGEARPVVDSALTGQPTTGNNKTPEQQDGRPAGEDVSSDRSPGLRVWLQYYTQTSVVTFVLVVLTFLITQLLLSSVDIYLTVWSNLEENANLIKEITTANRQQVDNFQHLINVSYHISTKNNHNNNDFKRIPYDSSERTLPETMTTIYFLPVIKLSDQQPQSVQQIKDAAAGQVEMAQIAAGSFLSLPSFLWESLPLAGANGNKNNSPPLVDSTDGSILEKGTSHNYTTLINNNNLSTSGAPCNALGATSSASDALTPQPSPRPCAKPHFSNIASFLTLSTPVPQDAFLIPSSHVLPVVDENMLAQSNAPDNIAPIYRPLYSLVSHFHQHQHATIYASLLVALFLFSLTCSTLFLRMLNNSTKALFKNLIDSALFSKIAFFDQNPVGRFLNRATYDIGVMDALIPLTALGAYEAILMTMASLIVVASVDLVLSIPSLVVITIVMMFHTVHIVSIKEIKRLESISRSPIISHISSSLEGVQTIRSNRAEGRFSEAYKQHLDFHTSIYLLYIGANRFLAVFLDSVNCSYVGVIAVWAVVSGMNGASAGLAITTALLLSGVTQNGIMKWTDAESGMTSVERVIEYCKLPQEEYNHNEKLEQRSKRRNKQQQQQTSNSSGQKSDRWLTKGRVEYECVDLYYNKTGKPVLKNISFKLEPGEKVAIVGRTGAGKSSIISTLFRLYDYDGRILIDGHDIKEINLIELRKNIGIIPQSPVLLSDSIRKNLDPTNAYDDFSMWNALDKAHLRSTVSALPGKLDCVIGDGGGGGGGFSSGQKQLICLARVLLRKCKVIIMDEATANMDPTTDAIIQSTIRHEFKHSTVITIAHRLETIVDYDRIIVLDAGRIVDFDTPEQLAIKSNSYISDQLRKYMKK